MCDILVIQNAKYERLSYLGTLFEADGFKIKTVFAKNEMIPKFSPRIIVILGAPESANDNFPHLKEEIRLIQDAVKNEIPTLGICLGSQLIAKSFGARVYQGKTKEIGIYHDIEFDNTTKSNLFSGIASPATVFHWHGDTFDLPNNAIRLAYSKNYKNQAFKIGSAVGVQFHLEVDEKTIILWLEKSKGELSQSPYIKPAEILERIPENIHAIQNNMKIFYQNFKSEFNL